MVESLEKPGNLGAIVRTADAAGVSDAVLESMPVAGGNAEGWPESDFDR